MNGGGAYEGGAELSLEQSSPFPSTSFWYFLTIFMSISHVKHNSHPNIYIFNQFALYAFDKHRNTR